MNKKLYQSLSIIIGLFMFTTFIWLRFIRERLPKEVPFNLSLLGFCILVSTCGIFLYIVISLFRENKPLDPLLKQMIDAIYVPLKTLDHFIKNLSYTNNTYKYGINILAYLLGPIIIDSKIFYYIFVIIPRLILLATLYIDVFWYNKLSYVYKILLIGILILVGKYIIYSFKYAKENFIESFKDELNIIMSYEYAIQVVEDLPPEDEDEADYVPETMVVPLKIFIEFQTNTFIEQQKYYPYMTITTRCDDSYYTKRNLLQPREYSDKEIDKRVENILQVSLLLAYYNLTHANPNVKRLRILIFMNYFICWLYILLMSSPSLFYASFWELWIIFNIQDIEEPFSSTNIY